MTHVLTIAGREFRERRMVFAGAAMIATMPFLFALLPSAAGTGRAVRIAGTGGILAVCWAAGLAIVLGLAIVSKELAERRLSFYLTKPISPAALWLGKLAAAYVLVLITTLIVLVPSLVVGWSVWDQSWSFELGQVVTVILGASLALLLIFHTVGTSFRSRSPLIAFDVLLIAVLIGGTWLVVQPLLLRMSRDNAAYAAGIVAGGFILSVVPAGVWQIARGRSDARKSHAALLKFTAVAAVVALTIAAIFVAWILSAGLDDLLSPSVAQAPTGSWGWAMGKAISRNDYHPMFLLNVASGKHYSVAGTRIEPTFSRDGQSVAWARFDSVRSPRVELIVSRLDGPSPRHIDTGVSAGWWRGVVLSDDGRRLAAITGDGLLSVIDVDAQRILGSVNTTKWVYGCDLFFADDNTVRIYERDVSGTAITMRVLEFDVAQRKLTRTGELTRQTKSMWWVASSTGTRMLINVYNSTDGGEGLMLVDGRNLQRIAGRAVAGRRAASTILANGDVLLQESASPRLLRVIRRDGVDGPTIPMPGEGPVWIAGEIEPSKVLIRLLRDTPKSSGERTLLVLDVNTGRIEKQAEGLTPTAQSNGSDARISPPGLPRSLLVKTESGLFTWDPRTGERKKLAS